MNFKSMLILSLAFLGLNLQAQSEFSGTVLNEKQEAIFFATIGLYSAKDSLLAKAIATEENGSFSIENVKDGSYFLVASMLGYQNFNIDEMSFPRDHQRSLSIILKEDSEILDGVEIKARAPRLEQRSDRLIVNVANDKSSLNNSLLDVIKQVPGMIVTGEKIRMAGQSNLTILINGKSTRYMDMQSLLTDMPADNIQKIEVIHQPGAEFEASGTGPIINIILKKNSLFGTNGSVNIGAGKGRDWRYKTGLNLSHYEGKLNISGGMSLHKNASLDELIISRKVQGDQYNQRSIDPNFSRSLNAGLSLDYDLNDKHRIGLASQYKVNQRDNTIANNTTIDYISNEQTDIFLSTDNTQDNQWNLFTINPYYVFEIDTNGQKLEIDYNLASFQNDGTSNLNNTIQNSTDFFPDQQFISLGNTMIMAAKVDYLKPINKQINISIGAKYSSADLDNDFQVYDENESNEFQNNVLQSNQFLLKERIIGVYSKSTWSHKKWSGTLGLRYEDSYTEGRSVQIDTLLTREIKQFFPSMSIAREITSPLKIAFAYSYRIDRPRYSTLNPFRFYLDPYTFDKGNPTLQPALTHSAKINLIYENQPFFNIEYKESDNAIVEVLEQNDITGQTNRTTLNLDKFRNFNSYIFAPLDFIPKMSGYIGGMVNYSAFDSPINDFMLSRNRWSFTGFGALEFTLPGDIDSEISAWYNSGELDGVIRGEYLYGVSLGFSKKILKNKGLISIGVEDLFFRPFYGNVKYSTLDVSIINNWDGPLVNAKFNYKFGNQHMKKKKSTGGSANDMIQRAEN